jgi:hypothetical protein
MVLHSVKSYYQCPSCDQSFKITPLQDFFALHGITKGSEGNCSSGNYSNVHNATEVKNATVYKNLKKTIIDKKKILIFKKSIFRSIWKFY